MSPEPQAVSVEEEELPNGTSLFHGQFKIESFLSSGGFGVTYLARDSLDRRVVIKECFPAATCRREGLQVVPQHRVPEDDFRAIVELFVDEARNLAKLEHPNIVGVHQVFEDNGTAYMALDYIRGRELLDLIDELGGPPAPEDVMTLLRVMLDTVEYIHDRGILHRDISPDNILIQEDGTPVLIDFGAARADAMFRDRRTAILAVKDGYSPQEFYVGGSQQVPSSDLYSLAATLYHLVSGDAPVSSNDRLAAVASHEPDPIIPLVQRATGYDDQFVASIDRALEVFQRDRFAAASDWRSFVFPSSDTVTQLYDSNGQSVAAGEAPKGKPKLKVVTEGDLTTTNGNAGEGDVRAAVQAAIADQDVPGTGGALAEEYIDEAEDADRRAQMPAAKPAQKSFDQAMVDTAPKSKKGPWLALGAVAVLGGTVAAAALLINPSSDPTPNVSSETPVVAETTPAATPAPVETVSPPEDVAVATPAPAATEPTETTVTAPSMGQPLRVEDLPDWIEVTNPAPGGDSTAGSDAPGALTATAPEAAPTPSTEGEPVVTAALEPAPSSVDPDGVSEPGLPDQAAAGDAAPAEVNLPNPAETSDVLSSVAEAEAPAEVASFELPQIIETGLEAAPRPLQVQAPSAESPAGLAETPIETIVPQVTGVAEALGQLDAEPVFTALPNASDAPIAQDTGVALAAVGAQEVGPRADTAAPAPFVAPVVTSSPVFEQSWSVDLPFATNTPNDTNIFAVRVDAPSWMQTGQRIVSVNGVPVTNVENIRQMVQASGEPNAEGNWTAVFGIREEGETAGQVIEIELPSKRVITLPNEISFESNLVSGAWQTVVAESPLTGDTALQTGDVLIGFIPTNEKLDGQEALQGLLEREVAAGRTKFDFAVQRDGALWVVSMEYPQ